MSISIALTCTGETPLLHDKPSTDIDIEIDFDATIADKRTHKDFATLTNPVILRELFLERLRLAGEFVKFNGQPLTNNNRSIIMMEATITTIEFEITSGGGLVANLAYVDGVRYIQPRWDDWEIGVTIFLNEDNLPSAKLRSAVDLMGQRHGLSEGDLAPAAYFGQFLVTSWAETVL